MTGADFPGFYINTNKTQDIELKSGRGYEIPWNYTEVVGWLCELREFQSRYNPIFSKTDWVDIRERYIKLTFSIPQLKERGGETFLFRDPCSMYPNEPVSDSRVSMFWAYLCAEGERRLAQEGATLTDGTPITLVKWELPHGRTSNPLPLPLYDLHSLRVGLLTSLATEGKVPIPILSRCVAGHSTILMTIYYQDLGISYINDVLTEAGHQARASEQKRFLGWI
jgi:hypothetical protein